MRRALLALPLFLSVSLAACSGPAHDSMDASTSEGFFELSTRTLDGRPQDLAAFQGKAVLVVNVASECGLTPQYADLQAVHERYADAGLVVVGFPCNQFRGQEPGTPDQIAAFCQENYGVTFPLMQKVEVLDGPGQSPVYRHLVAATGSVPDWNFAKYLVSRDGSTVTFFGARTEPLGPELTNAIEAAL